LNAFQYSPSLSLGVGFRLAFSSAFFPAASFFALDCSVFSAFLLSLPLSSLCRFLDFPQLRLSELQFLEIPPPFSAHSDCLASAYFQLFAPPAIFPPGTPFFFTRLQIQATCRTIPSTALGPPFLSEPLFTADPIPLLYRQKVTSCPFLHTLFFLSKRDFLPPFGKYGLKRCPDSPPPLCFSPFLLFPYVSLKTPASSFSPTPFRNRLCLPLLNYQLRLSSPFDPPYFGAFLSRLIVFPPNRDISATFFLNTPFSSLVIPRSLWSPFLSSTPLSISWRF